MSYTIDSNIMGIAGVRIGSIIRMFSIVSIVSIISIIQLRQYWQ